jgi:hypothetical protein
VSNPDLIQERDRWRVACSIDCDVGEDEVLAVDRWDSEHLWGLSSRTSFIAEDEVDNFMQTKFGKLVGVSKYAPIFREAWSRQLLIKDEGIDVESTFASGPDVMW